MNSDRIKNLATLLLAFGLLITACFPGTNLPEPTAGQVGGVTSALNRAPASITVMAAASLNESFSELGKQFEGQNPGVKVQFSFAGSQQLAQQLADNAPADVFASASQIYIDSAVKSGRIDPNVAKTFAYNRLVVIYPKDNPAGLKALQDLARPGLKLDFADKGVPVGQYSLTFLDKASKDVSFSPTYKADVLKNVVSYEDNVKAVLTKVVLGEVDAGIVYTSDIISNAAGQVGWIDIPDTLNVIAVYPIAVLKDSRQTGLANAFVDLVLSPAGQAVLAKYGFVTVTSPTPSATQAIQLETSSVLPTAALADTVTATPLPTATLTATPTATFTLTPSLTPTRTPAYNLMGLYKVGRCVQYEFPYSDPAPGGRGLVNMCLVNVQVYKDQSMQFNMTWTLVSSTGSTPNRYVYGSMDALYLTDEFGTRYDPMANSGKEPDRDENKDGVDTISGWYLFPKPVKTARVFTLHDEDGKSLSINYLSFITK